MTSSPSLTRTLRLFRPLDEAAGWLASPKTALAGLPGIEISGSSETGWNLRVARGTSDAVELHAETTEEPRSWSIQRVSERGPAAQVALRLESAAVGCRAILIAGPTADGRFDAHLAEAGNSALYQLLLNLDGDLTDHTAELGAYGERPVEDTATRRSHPPSPGTDKAPTDQHTGWRWHVVLGAVGGLAALAIWAFRRRMRRGSN